MTDTKNNFNDFENCLHGMLDRTDVKEIQFETLDGYEHYDRKRDDYTDKDGHRHITLLIPVYITMDKGS